MSRELWTVIIDAVVSIAIMAIGIWVAPEYREFALAVVAALQGIAAALIVHFVAERKVSAMRMEIQSLLGRHRS